MFISSQTNGSGAWMRELELQRERAWTYFQQIVAKDYLGSERPIDMLERSVVIACFAMTRTFDTEQIAAAVAAQKISLELYEISMDAYNLTSPNSSPDRCQLAGKAEMTVREFAKQVTVCSNIAVACWDARLPEGMFISFKNRGVPSEMLFLTLSDFMKITGQVIGGERAFEK